MFDFSKLPKRWCSTPPKPRKLRTTMANIKVIDKIEHSHMYEIMSMWISSRLEKLGCSEKFVLTIFVEIPSNTPKVTWMNRPKNLEVVLYEEEKKPAEYYKRIMEELGELCKAYDDRVVVQPNAKPFEKIIITTNKGNYKLRL